jgi:hypothetical protein
MVKMRDTITMGTIAGLISATILSLFLGIVRLLGFKFITISETAASVILNRDLIHAPIGYLVGYLVHFTLGAVFGIVVGYTLRITGKDFYLLKGIGIGAVVWLVSIGFFMRLLHIELQGRSSPLSNLMAILEFNIMGIITAVIIKKYADFKVKY